MMKRHAVPLTVLLFILFAAPARQSTPEAPKDDDFRWEEAAREVADLPYPQRFIDSLRAFYKVSLPKRPLRTVENSAVFRGETLVYDVGWGPFKAGYVILTADLDTARNILRVGGKALSNNFVGAFYRMRDYVLTHLDATGLYPLFFEQHLREGKKYRSDGWILYDHVQGKIHVKERHHKTLDAPPFVNDYLSVLYLIRTRSFAPGDTFTLPIYVDKKVHTMYFICRERKTLSIESGDITCVMLEPRLVAEKGNFNKKDKLEVWFADDCSKRPVLIRSKIKVGAISARLINHRVAVKKASSEPKRPALDAARVPAFATDSLDAVLPLVPADSSATDTVAP